MDTKVIHKNLHYLLDEIGKDSHHSSLKCPRGIAQAKRHSCESISAVGTCKGCFPLVIQVDSKLVETQISIEKTKELMLG